MSISSAQIQSQGSSLQRWRGIVVLQAALIVVASWFVFSPVFHGGWLWDDNTDITNNDLLDDASGLRKIWFAPESLDYYPIKASVQWVQWQCWGDNPLGYHLTNVVLHVLSAFLFWRVLRKLGVNHGWLGGLLFAVHPMVVESVAWIAELKNALSLPPLLFSICAYLDYDERGRRTDYVLSIAFFLIAMLCKSAMVMFPFALLLFAWWKRGRITIKDLAASAPYFGISLALGLVTFWLQAHRSIGAAVIPLGGPLSRLACAGLVGGFTLFHCVIPIGLIPIYPHWPINPPSAIQFLSWLAGALVALWSWKNRRGWGRDVLFGLGWFFLHLVPVLGFVAISYMRFTWVMDHLAYLSVLGVIGLAVGGAGVLYRRLRPGLRIPAVAAALGLCAGLAVAARGYASHFKSSEALWDYTIERNPDAWLAHFNLGIVLNDAGRKDEAIVQYREAIRLKPDYPEALNNLASLLIEAGHPKDAVPLVEKAVELQSDFVNAENNWGNALMKLGRPAEALHHFERASGMDPGFVDARVFMCDALMALRRYPEALVESQKAVRLDPDVAETHNSLGMALRANGRPLEAIEQYRLALKIKPEMSVAHQNLATSLAIAGRFPEAIAEYREALRLKPQWADAESNLGLALAKSGQLSEAVVHDRLALKWDPGHYEAHLNLGHALTSLGNLEEGKRELDIAAQIAASRHPSGH